MHSVLDVQRVPPAPHVMAQLYADYKREAKDRKISFHDYLVEIGFTDPGERVSGTDTGRRRVLGPNATLVQVPKRKVTGTLRIIVLLVDFSDNPGERSAREYEDMLFSTGVFQTGSMREFYAEVSLGKVEVVGSVHGWFRMPKTYSYYVNNESGLGTYPQNAQRLAEDAVQKALSEHVSFSKELDKFGDGAITGLFIVHAGPGAEVKTSVAAQRRHIWSHKTDLQNAVTVREGLDATNYLTVPEDCRMGVCAHELGHLAFQWDDFYDPNYEKGGEWDGAGSWDLMAGGSWNDGGNTPAHPAGLHKLQHGWVDMETVATTVKGLLIPPYSGQVGKVVRVKSPVFSDTEAIVLENRQRQGFDFKLPGDGLLVWRVDTKQEMVAPDKPAMLLVQADGRHDLEIPGDFNEGDAGDPFPGTAHRTTLSDQGDISTSFSPSKRSGISLSNIAIDSGGNVKLDITVASLVA